MRRLQVLLTIPIGCLMAACMGACVGWPGQETKYHGQHLEDAMTFDDKRFEEVELNSLGPSPCSPEMPADRGFRGIIIVAPKWISLSPGRISPVTIPICGVMRQEALRMSDGGAETLNLVVINQETEETFSGYPVFSDMAEPPPPDENPIRPEELEGIVVGVYFNFDLMEVVRLPREEGIYNAWMELNEEGSENHLRSNTVTFQLVRERQD